jgi:hypothetical protein
VLAKLQGLCAVLQCFILSPESGYTYEWVYLCIVFEFSNCHTNPQGSVCPYVGMWCGVMANSNSFNHPLTVWPGLRPKMAGLNHKTVNKSYNWLLKLLSFDKLYVKPGPYNFFCFRTCTTSCSVTRKLLKSLRSRPISPNA